MGLKDEILKLNLETGKAVNLLSNDLGDPDLTDIRVISFNTAQKLGVLDKDGEAKAIRAMARALALANLPQFPDKSLAEEMLSEGDTALPISNKVLESSTSTGRWANYSFSSYFQSSLANGNLISLALVSDRDFINAIDNAGKILSPKLSFDDAKYEPVFNKLEQYFQHFNISLKFQSLGYDFDGPNSNHNNINCDKAEITGNGLGLVSNRFEAFNSGYSNTNENWVAKISLPRTFRSENHFLKAGADVIASNLFKNFDPSFSSSQYVNNNINFDESERKFLVTESIHDKYTPHKEFIKSMTGIMFAAQLGAPVTQNDINRFNSLNIPNQDFKMLFDISTKANNYLKDIFLNKELIPADSAPSLWQQWKKDLISHAMQMATPSIPQICKQYNVEVTRDNVIRALNDLTNQKVNEVAQSKEPIKAALSQDQPINQAMLTKSRSVPADKSKEPQTKGAER